MTVILFFESPFMDANNDDIKLAKGDDLDRALDHMQKGMDAVYASLEAA